MADYKESDGGQINIDTNSGEFKKLTGYLKDTRGGTDEDRMYFALGRMDGSFPKTGTAQPAHMGSQSTSPTKEGD